jgi:hypothetical protein
MKISFSRSSILTTLLILIILATLPGQIRRLVQTGPYLFTWQFFQDMVARLSGPGRLRFLLQPSVAVFLGIRDGKNDARKGSPPFVWALLYHRERRLSLLRDGVSSIRELVAIAILLDMISQYLIFREIHVGAALILGPALISVPYALSRTLANSIVVRRRQQMPVTRHD